jgi:hypothetical protein
MHVIKKQSYRPLCMRNEHNVVVSVRGNGAMNMSVLDLRTRW